MGYKALTMPWACISKWRSANEEAYIEVLPQEMKSQKAGETVEQWSKELGEIVQMDEEEQSRGYGFVHFAQKEHAAKAEQLLNGMQIGSSCIQVRQARPEDLEVFTGCIYSLQAAVSAVCPPAPGEWMTPVDYASGGGWEDFDGFEGWDEAPLPHG
eukprot:s48_g9.t1